MTAITHTVAFEGITAHPVEVQCAVSGGVPSFQIVGLPQKAVSEARERIRLALSALSISLPSKRIIVNLSPADMPKDGAHYDLPIAIAVLSALGMIAPDDAAQTLSLGELSLNGKLKPVKGCLPAAVQAGADHCQLICPAPCGSEAAWVAATKVIAPADLSALIYHFNGNAVIAPALPGQLKVETSPKDMAEVKGQERAKRALEIAAAGRHHVLLCGPPGSGKSMLAARLSSILPPLSADEALEVSMIHSLAGLLEKGGITATRPFRAPHHTSSMAAIVGGGRNAGPGEISLAHHGVLFMDEFPEYARGVLETLRQPLETGEVIIARANAHIKYPCKFMLIAAANPCKCGYLADSMRACSRAPHCGDEYMGRISGPLMDRFDLVLDVPPVSFCELEQETNTAESSASIAARISAARDIQSKRYQNANGISVNADAEGAVLSKAAPLKTEAKELLKKATERLNLSVRSFHRIQRISRTIADLEGADDIERVHIAEAISYRPSHIPSYARKKRNAAEASQPATMAMPKDKRP